MTSLAVAGLSRGFVAFAIVVRVSVPWVELLDFLVGKVYW